VSKSTWRGDDSLRFLFSKPMNFSMAAQIASKPARAAIRKLFSLCSITPSFASIRPVTRNANGEASIILIHHLYELCAGIRGSAGGSIGRGFFHSLSQSSYGSAVKFARKEGKRWRLFHFFFDRLCRERHADLCRYVERPFACRLQRLSQFSGVLRLRQRWYGESACES